MQFNISDRTSFEAFGSRPPQLDLHPNDQPANFNDVERVDVLHSASIAADEPETPQFNFTDERSAPRAEEPSIIEPTIGREIKTGISWASLAGGLASFAWIGGALGVPVTT